MARPNKRGTKSRSPFGNMERYADATSVSTAVGSLVATGEIIMSQSTQREYRLHENLAGQAQTNCEVISRYNRGLSSPARRTIVGPMLNKMGEASSGICLVNNWKALVLIHNRRLSASAMTSAVRLLCR